MSLIILRLERCAKRQWTGDYRYCRLQHIPDCLVTQQVWPWHNDKLIEWYEGYKKLKVQKTQIRLELMPIAWHPSR